MKAAQNELELGESYQLDVVVADMNGVNFFGKLSLSPEKCSIVISGEISEGRKPEFDEFTTKRLVARNTSATYILIGLRLSSSEWHVLTRAPNNISAFETSFDISYVVSTSTACADLKIGGFEICTRELGQWIGHTQMQHDLVNQYQNKSAFKRNNEPPFEFSTRIEDIGWIGVGYAATAHYAPTEFSSGLQFPPRLVVSFDDLLGEEAIIAVYTSLTDFLAVVLGYRLSVEKIYLDVNDQQRKSTLYFPASQYRKEKRPPVFFPLGQNLAFGRNASVPFPVASFSAFFEKGEEVKRYFEKYVKYRELQNPEERFLGYFRLVEKLTYIEEPIVDPEKLSALLFRTKNLAGRYLGDEKGVKRLLGEISRANKNRYNTAACLAKFMKEFPATLKRHWDIQSKDIQSICQLRNDLTHANERAPDTSQVELYAKFIEVLLVIALFREVDVSPDMMASVISRLDGYSLIQKRPTWR